MIVHCTRKLAARLPEVSATRSLMQVDHVLDLDPVVVSHHLNERPAMADGVLHWPGREMLELVARL